jgi:hypothetical protein
MWKHLTFFLCCLLSWFSAPFAATDTWDSGASGNWSSNNWNTGGSYTSNNNAYINNGSVSIPSGSNIDAGTGILRVGNDASTSALLTIHGDFRAHTFRIGNNGTGNITVHSGNLKVDGAKSFMAYNTGSVGYLNLYDSNFIGAAGEAFDVSRDGAATLSANNSSIHQIQALYLANRDNAAGNIHLYGSNLMIDGQFYIANGINSTAQFTSSSSNISGKNFNMAVGSGSNAHVSIENSYLTCNTNNAFLGAEYGSGNLYIAGSNVSGFASLYFGDELGSQCYAKLSNSSFDISQEVLISNKIGSKAHFTMENCIVKTSNSSSSFKLGSDAYAYISNSDISGFSYFNCSQEDASSANVILSATNIQLNSGFRFPRGDNSSCNAQIINGCNLTSAFNNAFNVAYGNNSYGEFIARDSYFNLQSAFLLGSGHGSLAKFSLVNNEIYNTTSGKNFVIADSGNAIGSVQGGNLVGFNNLYYSKSANTISHGSMGQIDMSIGSHIYFANGENSHANVIMNNMTILTTGSSKDIKISSGNHSSSNVIITHSNFGGFQNMQIGGNMDTTNANVIITSSNLSLGNNFRIGNSGDAYPSSAYVSNCNIIASQLTLSNNAFIRFTGGSSNFIARTSFTAQPNTKWEHVIDSKNGPFGHMPTVYSQVDTDTDGHLKIGFSGGSAFVSSNVFFTQVSTTGHKKTGSNHKYGSTPSHWELSLQDPAPDGLYKVKATMSAANLVGALDLAKGGTKTIAVGGRSLGYLSVANVNSSEQIFGLNVLFQLASGTPQDIVNDLIAAGYHAELTSFGSYQLKYRIPATNLVNGTGYLMWDFRDITTGAGKATVQQIMVAPVVSGSTIIIQ